MDPKKNRFPFRVNVVGLLLALILRFIFLTSRKQYSGLDHLRTFFKSDQPFILVAWHNRNILSCFGYLAHRRPGRVWVPLASASKDGSYAAAAMKHLGVDCIRGSSSRGGMQALRAMLRQAKLGNDLGITPDGPRGPKYIVQEGVITTAKLTGLPIIPMAYQAKRKKILDSWDNMIVPFPFNRLKYVYGPPIFVPRDLPAEEHEKYRVKVEQALMRVCELTEDFG